MAVNGTNIGCVFEKACEHKEMDQKGQPNSIPLNNKQVDDFEMMI